ncbi:MAG TPA: adenylate/guanylate cyclase domain-containing protein [Saprospiraceae bacterium]|nr:tetratricopeptide repeat protein [Lewinellaceae bacterium]HQU58559.1 adenylate/guanylate cyclase domain-containing protein [Saprospiraceae bacterium]
MPPIRRLAAIMFADIAGYTAMMQANENDGMRRLKRFRAVLDESVEKHQGRVLQHYGDGSLVLFDSAVEAVASAKEIQLALLQEPKVPLRIGIHIGDIVTEEDYIYGDGVNLASRVESLGVPGSILITERVIHDLRNHPQFEPVSLGKFEFKNVTEPMEVFALADTGIVVPRQSELAERPKVRPSKQWGSGAIPKGRIIGLATLVVICLAIAAWLFRLGQQQGRESLAIPDKSIAVLPFRDLSPEGGQQYFGDGIAEDILNALAQSREMKVAGRTSSFSFRGTEISMPEIGRKLGVSTVLEGSIRRIGEQVRVTAQLINTADGYQIWSQRYDRQIDDIFAIQDEIAQAVAENLKVILLHEGIQPATRNQEAYDWYLRGRHMLSQRSDGAEAAVDFFQRALELDPDFAMAYAGLGNAYLWLGWSNILPSREAFPQARTYAGEALKRDSTLAYAHSILGSVHLWYDWDWPAARQALEKAIALNPSEAGAYLDLGWYYAVAGDLNRAILQMEKAVSIDPLNLEYNIDLADINRMAGHYEKARDIGAAMQELYPDNSEAYWLLGLVDYVQGNYKTAVGYFRESVRLSKGESWSVMHLSMAQAKAGQQVQAQQQLLPLEKDTAVVNAAFVEMAPAYWNLGQHDKALAWLERSFQQHANWMISLQMDPIWDEMRKEARFQELVEKMKFP